MSVLSVGERKVLSDVVVEAREVVEKACRQRVAALAVEAERIPDVLTGPERELSKALRARRKQLGSVDALVAEAEFEHWHRMLFTRYLADNNLLVDDEYQQRMTLDEVTQLAAELGEPDVWEVAARFAAAMLPGIFRQDDPVLAMRLPVETRQRLEDLLGSLPTEVITAEDSLGWVYQYWQARRKDEVNRSERKIGGADLAPVTQLFTENYMVRFLLENSLGAWWAARHPDSPLLEAWEYLRYAEDGTPAAGSFEEWPATAAEVTVMDPCCGSGHFLVAAFGMLWRMRAEQEGLDVAAAQDAVLRDNLFGLELDPRCTQIAAFALALEAWKTGGYRPLPLPHIACSGIPAKAPLADWTALADGDPQVEAALTRLHALFANADTLGSLIDPIRATEQAGLESMDWHTIAPLLTTALTRDSKGADPAAAVFGQAAAGIARAADYLTRTYTLTVTNVPYLGRGKQSEVLQRFSELHFPEGMADLGATLLARFMPSTATALAFVSGESWTFVKSYQDFRALLLGRARPTFMATLGTKAFSTPMYDLAIGLYLCRGDGRTYRAVDASGGSAPFEKARELPRAGLIQVSVPPATGDDNRIVVRAESHLDRLSAWATVHTGLQNGDKPRYVQHFWERGFIDPRTWVRLLSAVGTSSLLAGREELLRWELGRGALASEPGAVLRGLSVWGKDGVSVSRMNTLAATLYAGEAFDQNCAVLLPKTGLDRASLWCYLSSPEFNSDVRKIDKRTGVAPKSLLDVPFDVERWRRVAAERFPDGLPEPFSDDPTQWLFKGDPVASTNPLQVAVARLLGYRWPDQEPDALDEWADSDGVVCLPAVGGELQAVDRLLQLLARAYGEQWSPAVLDGLLAEVGAKPGTAGLAAWLRNNYFKDHCKMFANRPFVWQIWDGTTDGFSALVNYHRLDRRLLERLTYDYLGSWWIGRVRHELAQETPGADKRLAAAEGLKQNLELILEGEGPYDIYVRWKDPREQPLGWEPDLDDGVRLNIRPFMTANILRSRPSIKWTKDRGKNPDGTERHNDRHTTLAQKRAAQGNPT